MGTSASWYAIRGKSPQQVLRDFGLRSIGKEYRSSPYGGGPISGGWFLVYHARYEFRDAELRKLSRNCDVVACFIEEHVMFSRSSAWRDGNELWSVTHDSEQDLMHLGVRGDPPVEFAAIEKSVRKQQDESTDEVDYIFNIPIELAESVTGYNHDTPRDFDFEIFVKQSFLQRLFG